MTGFSLLFRLLPEKVLAKWWNKQWTRSIAFWDYGHGNQNVNDCLLFDSQDKAEVQDILWMMGNIPKDDDSKVKYVTNKINTMFAMSIPKANGGAYVHDSAAHGVPDYWQSPKETLKRGTGDCDDWGILLYCLLRQAGVPAYRLKCCITNVQVDGKFSGAHFNLLYLARYDHEWYTLEGSWFPSIAQQRFLNTPRKKSDDYYGDILFTFNEEFTWAQHDLKVKPVFLDLKELDE